MRVQHSSAIGDANLFQFHTCTIDAGVVTCWGRNTRGQLGAGVADSDLGADYSALPLRVAGQP